MALRHWHRRPAAVAVLGLALGSSATAQTHPPSRPDAETFPLFAAAVSVGLKVPYDTPDASIRRVITSASFAVVPRLRIEGEWFAPATVRRRAVYSDNRLDLPYTLRSTAEDTDRMQGGAALMTFEFLSGRVRPFAGGGVLFERHRMDQRLTRSCEPRVTGGCNGVDIQAVAVGSTHIDVHPQGSVGMNVRLTPRLFGFGALRIDDGLTVHGGATVVVTRRTVPRGGIPAVARGSVDLNAEQPDVRVILASGLESRGQLISMSATAVQLRSRSGTAAIPLADVRGIERVTHRVRNGALIGLAAGFAIGYLGSCGSGDEEDCWPEIGLMVGGAGAGAGALIGMIMNRNAANDGRDMIYLAPARGGLAAGLRRSF
jgi:hypothetical protein